MPIVEDVDLTITDIRREMEDAGTRVLDVVRRKIADLSVRVAARDDGESRPLVETARRIVGLRRARRKFFSAELFHERAWDMLLELFIAQATNRDVWVKSLLGVADGSPTTAIRWLDHLESRGLILRRSDDADRRRVIVNLTHHGETMMENYLQEARSLM